MAAQELGEGNRRARRDISLARLGAVVAALLFVAFLVVSVSRAAFVATTENAANSVSTGTVVLTDDDSGVAMFNNITNLGPLDVRSHCIVVEYSGSLNPAAIRLYSAGAPTGTLASYLNLSIDMGTGGTFADCTGFTSSSTLYTGTLDGFATTYPDYANGLTTWDPAGPTETRTFKFTLTVQDVAAAAGKTAGFGFTWEVRSS